METKNLARTKPFDQRVSRSLIDMIDAVAEMTVLATPTVDATLEAGFFGFADTITCKTPEELAEVVVSLITAKFSYNLTNYLLEQQMTTYLKKHGVENDDMLAFMSEEILPMLILMGLDLKKLMIPVLRMLHSIAGMTVIM